MGQIDPTQARGEGKVRAKMFFAEGKNLPRMLNTGGLNNPYQGYPDSVHYFASTSIKFKKYGDTQINVLEVS
jgi:hypothetical protein